MAQQDYYETLGVEKNASAEDLKNAFRNLARKYHPDINKEPGAEDHFKQINEAYQVLSDSDKRAAYDRYGHAGVSNMGGNYGYADVDLSDILGDLFGFGGFGGFGGSRQRNAPRRGADLQTTLTIPFEESISGAEKEVQFPRNEKCSHCAGNGAEPGTKSQKCATCGGQGEVKTNRQTMFGSMVQVTSCPNCGGRGETIQTPCTQCKGGGIERRLVKKVVTIPPGVDNGTRIRLSGEGQLGENNGPTGDLYIELRVAPHKFFRRNEYDIYLDININIAQASLGDTIEIPTAYGPESLKIPAGTQPGKIFVLNGKGVPHLRGSGKGNQKVIANVAVPTELNAEQRELLEKLAPSLKSDVMERHEKKFWDKLKDAING